MRTPVRLTLLLAVCLFASPASAQEEWTAEETEATEIAADQPESPPPEDSPAAGATEDGLSPTDAVAGHFGLGYFTGFAPVGVRYWLSRDSAVDLGLDAAFSSGDLEAHRYGIELGYVMSLAHYHYSVVFARLGLGFRFLDSFGEHSTQARYDLNGSAFVGAELFLGAFGFPNVSLQGGYGLEADYTYSGGSAFLIGTVGGGLSVVGAGTLGFHIYL